MTDDPKGWSGPAQVESYADVGMSAVSGLSKPAKEGWILGFVLIFGILVGVSGWIMTVSIESDATETAVTAAFLTSLEANRTAEIDQYLAASAEQARRYQEIIKDLAEAVSNDSARAGQAAMVAIDRQSESLYPSTPIPQGALD